MTFEEWLEGNIDLAMKRAAESRAAAADSWGAGYDCGYSDALQFLFASLSAEVARCQITEQV